MSDDSSLTSNTSSWFYLTGGIGQLLISAGLAEAGSPTVSGQPNSFAVTLIAITGLVTSVGAVIQIFTNAAYKRRRLEVEVRLKRTEQGLPCEDDVCPIQRIAGTRIRPIDVLDGSGEFPFLKPVKVVTDEPTVDLSEMDGRE